MRSPIATIYPLLIVFIILVSVRAHADPADSAMFLQRQQELIGVQIENQREQARYYRQQSRVLAKDTAMKGLVEKLVDTPTTFLTLAAALLAALVTLLTFSYNYRATLRSQRDIQFYEALKRFGDKDSPTARASAAGLLKQMGLMQTGFRRNHRPYFSTAVDQLITGLSLEENRTVVDSIVAAIQPLVPVDPYEITQILYAQNQELQGNVTYHLLDFYAVRKENTLPDIGSESARLAATIGWPGSHVLNGLIQRYSSFDLAAMLLSHRAITDQYAGELRANYIEKIHRSLERRMNSLNANVKVLSHAIQATNWKLIAYTPRPTFDLIFLTDVSLQELEISNASFNSSQIQNVNLSGVSLPGADFSFAFLDKTNMVRAGLIGATFAYTNLADVDLEGAKLDRAEFWDASLDRTNMARASLIDAIFYKSRLVNVNLRGARLNGARFHGTYVSADLTDAILDGAIFDSANVEQCRIGMNTTGRDISMINTKWWKINFNAYRPPFSDILTSLYDRYKDQLPVSSEEWHLSVQKFVGHLERAGNTPPA